MNRYDVLQEWIDYLDNNQIPCMAELHKIDVQQHINEWLPIFFDTQKERVLGLIALLWYSLSDEEMNLKQLLQIPTMNRTFPKQAISSFRERFPDEFCFVIDEIEMERGFITVEWKRQAEEQKEIVYDVDRTIDGVSFFDQLIASDKEQTRYYVETMKKALKTRFFDRGVLEIWHQKALNRAIRDFDFLQFAISLWTNAIAPLLNDEQKNRHFSLFYQINPTLQNGVPSYTCK